jgi:hypothetical protein
MIYTNLSILSYTEVCGTTKNLDDDVVMLAGIVSLTNKKIWLNEGRVNPHKIARKPDSGRHTRVMLAHDLISRRQNLADVDKIVTCGLVEGKFSSLTIWSEGIRGNVLGKTRGVSFGLDSEAPIRGSQFARKAILCLCDKR